VCRVFMEDQTEHLRFMIQQMLMCLHTICHLWDQPSNSRHDGGLFECTGVFLFPHEACTPPDLKFCVHRPRLSCSPFDREREILSIFDSAELALDRLLWEFGHCLSAIADSEVPLDPVDLWAVALILHWFCEKLPGPSDLPGLSWDK
ncbi:hypothetical protein V8B97DRAFT_1988476, partial [Scleroderma yunnanense]